MPSRKSLDIDKIIILYKSGLTCKAISLQFNCGRETIRNRLMAAGIAIRTGIGNWQGGKTRVEGYRARRAKEWREKYPDHAKKYWHNLDPVLRRKARTESRRKAKTRWMEILCERKMLSCMHCGYNKSFVAIDYHHCKPEEKEKNIGLMLETYPTPETIKKLDGVVPLCSNCHRELHQRLRDELKNKFCTGIV